MTETAQDIEVVCQDCGETFVFTGAEAAFYTERSLSMPPKRCKECRGARGRRASGNDRSPARFPTGDPNEYRSPMPCEMPAPVWARPAGGRAPAASEEYRSPAFRERDEEQAALRAAQGEARPARRRERRVYQTVCSKCGATAHVPFEPSPNRDVLCKPCFDEKRGIAPAEPAEGL
jgi:CxxC-x17-CxxC domain-containing protein